MALHLHIHAAAVLVPAERLAIRRLAVQPRHDQVRLVQEYIPAQYPPYLGQNLLAVDQNPSMSLNPLYPGINSLYGVKSTMFL
jgi:hypothetical protein